jgi:very-short-patch-repair endonuclease
LRSSQTNAEYLLWYYLRNRHFQGFKFRRQHILQGYIVDFVCLQGKLIIEVDGGQHSERQDYDDYRPKSFKRTAFKCYVSGTMKSLQI